MNHIIRMAGLVLLLALPVFAQSGLGLTPLPLKGTLSDLPQAPTPRDLNGNPIQPKPPTAEEREAERQATAQRAESQRAEKQRAEAERQATDARRVADEGQTAKRLAEEQSFHSRIMTAVYVGLAIAAVGIGSRVLKKG